MPTPIHIHPTAELAPRVLLPGDPGRALLLAQALLAEPKMFNHNRGLWGYSGVAADGDLLTIQSTGMGGPSAAIVADELIMLGARRLIRVGTCGALVPELSLGQLLIVTRALAADGTSRALGAGDAVRPSPELLDALVKAGRVLEPPPFEGTVVSTDLFYDEREEPERAWRAAGAVAVEMETATLLAVASQRGVEAAAALIVSDVLVPVRTRIEPDALRAAEHRIGELASRALARNEAGVERS